MVVGLGHLRIDMPGMQSLKDKRRVIKSITQRVQNRFNVSVAEVASQDLWQVADLGLACVSNSPRHADEILQTVIRFVEENLKEGYLAGVRTEIIHAE